MVQLWSSRSCIVATITVVLCGIISKGSAYLWFPRYSVLQITMGITAPFEHPIYRVSMNWGLQCNVNLPWNQTEFTNPMFWEQRNLPNGGAPANSSRGSDAGHSNIPSTTRPKREISAGDFYRVTEQVFEMKGFHRSCVAKSICEMAQYPFHDKEEDENILTMIFHYIFTPSEHNGFIAGDVEEERLRNYYEKAEKWGRKGSDCDRRFKKCPFTPLSQISYIDVME